MNESKSYKTMTEKKIPTTQQMKEYRQLRKTMTTAEEYEKVMAFEEDYDIFTQVFTEEGRKGVKDAAGEVLVPADFDEVGCTFADFCRGFAIPVVKDGPVDEFLIGVGDSITEAEKKKLEKTLAFFIQYKDSGLTPIAEHIAMINELSNKPVVMLYDKKTISFHHLQEVA